MQPLVTFGSAALDVPAAGVVAVAVSETVAAIAAKAARARVRWLVGTCYQRPKGRQVTSSWFRGSGLAALAPQPPKG